MENGLENCSKHSRIQKVYTRVTLGESVIMDPSREYKRVEIYWTIQIHCIVRVHDDVRIEACVVGQIYNPICQFVGLSFTTGWL